MKRRAVVAAAALLFVACAAHQAAHQPSVFTGLYRQGFEHSDFYPAAGGGPWWLTAEEDVWTSLQTHARGEGRGRFVTVRITVDGVRRGPFDPQIRPAFADSVHAARLVAVEPVSDEIFEAAMRAARSH